MDALTDSFAYVGTRATGGRRGRYSIAGPGWRGQAPAGVTLSRSGSNDVWMLARVLVDGLADLDAAKAIQAQVEVIVPPGRARIRGEGDAGAARRRTVPSGRQRFAAPLVPRNRAARACGVLPRARHRHGYAAVAGATAGSGGVAAPPATAAQARR